MINELTFITGNLQKVEWFNKYIGLPIKHHNFDLTEIQSLDVREVVKHKAIEAYKQIGKPVLVEDTSLTFNALGRLPGPFIKWFLEEIGNEGLCRSLDAYEDKSAFVEVVYALYDGKIMKLFEGKMNGTITKHPQGEGHGWIPIFIPEGCTTTWGEMSEEEQDKTALRKKIIKELKTYLTNL